MPEWPDHAEMSCDETRDGLSCDHSVALRDACEACRDVGSDHPIVLVTWIDSGMAHFAEWKTAEDYLTDVHDDPDYMRTVSVGYLMHQDAQHIMLGQTWSRSTGKFMNAETIHAPSVESVVTLVEGRRAD